MNHLIYSSLNMIHNKLLQVKIRSLHPAKMSSISLSGSWDELTMSTIILQSDWKITDDMSWAIANLMASYKPKASAYVGINDMWMKFDIL